MTCMALVVLTEERLDRSDETIDEFVEKGCSSLLWLDRDKPISLYFQSLPVEPVNDHSLISNVVSAGKIALACNSSVDTVKNLLTEFSGKLFVILICTFRYEFSLPSNQDWLPEQSYKYLDGKKLDLSE